VVGWKMERMYREYVSEKESDKVDDVQKVKIGEK
jgi:hypothetical protein